VHVIRVFLWGAYKRPREFLWMVGVMLMLCTLTLTHTGALLPWDQNAYWGTKVRLGVIGNTPGIGEGLRNLLQGGSQIGNRTLTRFFTLHVLILPVLFLALVLILSYLSRLHGLTPPWWKSGDAPWTEEEPFWPGTACKRGTVILVFLVGLGLWSVWVPAPLEAQANPSRLYEAHPEWYFRWLFQLRKYFEGPWEIVATFVLPSAALLGLFFWPFLDRHPQRDPRRRPAAMTLFGLGLSSLVGLTVLAFPRGREIQEADATPVSAPTAEPTRSAESLDVAKLYTENCIACHGVDGTGKDMRAKMPSIADFTNMAWQLSHTDQAITHLIQQGKEPLMPAYREKLTDQQIGALGIYIRTFAIGSTGAAVPKAAQSPPPPSASQLAPKQSGPRETQAIGAASLLISSKAPGQELYRKHCISCHDTDGRGRIARKAMPEMPDLTDPKWQAGHTDAELKRSILEGKGKFMLSMKDKLRPTDAEQLVAYVRAFGGGKQVVQVPSRQQVEQRLPTQPTVRTSPKTLSTAPPAVASASSKTLAYTQAATGLYRQYCLVCHGADGKGSEMKARMPLIPDFTSGAWQEGLTKAQLVVSVLDGKGTTMPAFRERVSEQQAEDLAAYVRAFGPAKAAVQQIESSDFDKRFAEVQAHRRELQEQFQKLSESHN
jgi:mono/diheme cytochrome c family protein